MLLFGGPLLPGSFLWHAAFSVLNEQPPTLLEPSTSPFGSCQALPNQVPRIPASKPRGVLDADTHSRCLDAGRTVREPVCAAFQQLDLPNTACSQVACKLD